MDGIKDGLWNFWYESGLKKAEAQYNISNPDILHDDSKCWDENGNECICEHRFAECCEWNCW